jgi:hypothetical protein
MIHDTLKNVRKRGWRKKRFFFEKKKQKTFGPAGIGACGARARRSEVFFASFLFTKKKSLASAWPAGTLLFIG